MDLLTGSKIQIAYALREQGPNIFMLTEGSERFPHNPQVFICRKREVAPGFLRKYYLLDSFDTKAYTHVMPEVVSAISDWNHNNHYVAKVECQIEFTAKRKVFDSLSEYLYPAWYPDYAFSSLEGQPSAFLVLMRAYRIEGSVPESLLNKGRQGASLIYHLYSGNNTVSYPVRIVQPVISDSRFDYVKQEIIHLLRTESVLIECYEDDEKGLAALEERGALRRSLAPKRAPENQLIDRAHLDYDLIYNRIIHIDPSLGTFINSVKQITPPQWGEAEPLVKRAQHGDEEAKTRLFEMFMRVVLKNALWMHDAYDVDIDDAIQESGIGLLSAIEKYHPEEQSKFSVYAPWWMRQRMMRELPVCERIMRLPIHYRERIIKIAPLVDDHMCEECSENQPCPRLLLEIQDVLGCDEDAAAIAWSFAQFPESIEALTQDEDSTFAFSDSGAQINSVDEEMDNAMLRRVVDDVLSSLKPREREIIEMRNGFRDNKVMTLEEIGATYGLTRERIRQVESKAEKKLSHRSRSLLLRPFYVDATDKAIWQ